MASIHFYLDEIAERNFSVDATELVSAPFEHASIYTLNYIPNILGPITQRKVLAAASVKEKYQFWKKLPLLAGSLKLPDENDSLVVISRGMISCSQKIKCYYLFDPYWEDVNYQKFFEKQWWPIRIWLNLHQKRVLQSFKKYSHKIICSSKHLALKYQLSSSQIVYPFYKTEDFPRVELVSEKKSFTILLQGATEEEKKDLAKWIQNFQKDWYFTIFGQETDRAYFPVSDHLRFEHQYCSATLQAAFLQSSLVFQFNHPGEFCNALGALASGVLVAHLNSPIIEETIPEGLRVHCQNLNQFINMATEMSMRTAKVDFNLDEARRFSLRFSERNFKDRLIKIISGK